MKLIYGYAFFIAAIGIALIIILMTLIIEPWWAGTGFAIGVIAVFAGIIALGLRQHRVRHVLQPLYPELSTVSATDDFRICLHQARQRWRKQKQQGLYIALGALPVLNVLLFLEYAHTGYLVTMLVAVNGGLFFMTILIAPFISNTVTKALRLVDGLAHRELVLDSKGISIPIEIVTEPALHIAVQAGHTEVRLVWSEITDWEVSDGMGDAPAQHSISVSPSNRYAGFSGRFGLIRVEEITQCEKDFIGRLQSHLQCPIRWAAADPGWIFR
jgi:hypothetical protein